MTALTQLTTLLRRGVWWVLAVFGVAFAALPFVAGCAHGAREDDPDVVEVVRAEHDVDERAWEGADDTLHDLERAFKALRSGKRGVARRMLERSMHRFDDLAMESTPLEAAFASDATKPYRGRPHERVLAAALLAALDIERGRCDLAVPTLRNAAFLDARARTDEPSDAVLVHALALRCIADTPGANGGDRERVRDDLRRALAVTKEEARLEELVALATAEVLDLELAGTGPTVVPEGAHGERVRTVPGVTAGEPVRIRLGARARDAGTRRAQVWSSTFQATTVSGRPYDEVLARRAVRKSETSAQGAALWSHAQSTTAASVRGGKLDPKQALAGALLATSSVGMTSMANATDARADTRFVRPLFETATLVAR